MKLLYVPGPENPADLLTKHRPTRHFVGNEFWTNNFDLRFLFHTDYPLFIQSTVSRIWSLLNFGLQNRDAPFHIPIFICGDKNKMFGFLMFWGPVQEQQSPAPKKLLTNDQ